MQYLGLISVLVLFPYFAYASLCINATVIVSYTSQTFRNSVTHSLFLILCLGIAIFYVQKVIRNFRNDFKKLGIGIMLGTLFYYFAYIAVDIVLSADGMILTCPTTLAGDSTHALDIFYILKAFDQNFMYLFFYFTDALPSIFVIGIVFFLIGFIKEKKKHV